MPSVLTTIPARIPGLTQQIIPTTREKTVAAFAGLRSWRDPESYDAARGLWIDRLHAGFVDGSMVNRHTGTPTVQTIGGKSWLVFNDVAKLGRLTNSSMSDLSPAEFTVAFNYHPNGMPGSHDRLISEPYDAVSDASNQFLKFSVLDNTSNFFVQLSCKGASEVSIAAPSSGAGLRSKTDPCVVLISYSVARGWTLRLASGASTTQVASPASNQIISRGQIQLGGAKDTTGSTNMMSGGFRNFMPFDIDLTGTAYSSLLTSVEAFLTSEQ